MWPLRRCEWNFKNAKSPNEPFRFLSARDFSLGVLRSLRSGAISPSWAFTLKLRIN